MKCDRCHRTFKPFYWFEKYVDERLDPNLCSCRNYEPLPHTPRKLCKDNLQHCIDNGCHFVMEHTYYDPFVDCGPWYDVIKTKAFYCKKCYERMNIEEPFY